MIVRDTVAPEGAVLQETESGVEAGAVLALLHLLLTEPAGPGERTDAVEISQEVEAVTLIEAGLGLALVNIHLGPELSSPWFQRQITHAMKTQLKARKPRLWSLVILCFLLCLSGINMLKDFSSHAKKHFIC